MFHLPKKILIGICLILSFSLTMFLGTILTPPYPRFGTILATIKKIQDYSGNFSLPKIALPSIFTKIQTQSPSTTGREKSGLNSIIFSKTSPAPTNIKPLITSETSSSTTTKLPTNSHQSPTTTSSTTIKPTNSPKPTKKPKATPTPTFALTNPRPGKNIREIAEIVGPLFCVPPAMVYAIYDNEAGYLGPKVNSNWIYYNTYQGSDPTDISGSTSVFGVTQMMGDTWHKIKPYVAKTLGSSDISLNVTFDSMAAAAFHIRNVSLAGIDHVSCTNWPVKYILYGACRYNGACPANTMGQTAYYNSYTYSVCASYNEYGADQKKCQ